MYRNTQATLGTVAALLLRLATGALFLLYGWRTLQDGIPATADRLESLGLPYATLAAPVLIGVQLLGGAALLLGLATRFAGLLLLLVFGGSWYLVHREAGVFADGNGWELAMVPAVALLGFVLAGSGGYGLDRLLARRRR